MIPGELGLPDIAAECAARYGFKIEDITEIQRVKHQLTHTDLDIRYFKAKTASEFNQTDNALLLVPSCKITEYPFPKPLIDFLANPAGK
jgi:adenine-specific DNA glycosylase